MKKIIKISGKQNKILRAQVWLSSRAHISSVSLFNFVEHGERAWMCVYVLIFIDDVQVSTIKCGAIKQFHHYKIQTRKCIPRADRISNKKNALNSVKIKQQRKANNKFVFFLCANLLRFHEHTIGWVDVCAYFEWSTEWKRVRPDK